MTAWLDSYQRRHRWAGFPIAVVYKFFEDQGAYLAALITFYGFLSLFPLLLLLASVLGFVLQNNAELQQRILDSALAQFPIIGDELSEPQGLRGNGVGVVVGGAIALYGALGVAQALQNAMHVAWSVPRNRRPNPLRARVRSLLLMVTAGASVIATTMLSALGGSTGGGAAVLSSWTAVVVTVAAVMVNTGVFIVAFRISAAFPLNVRQVWLGAAVAAVVWQLLQLFGTAYVGHVVKDAGITYGVFAVVLGLLAWIFLAALGVVFSVEINVVRSKALYPRALLTPFTDNVDLTGADQRAYTDAATAQRHKGFESVDVTFDHAGQNATARRQGRGSWDGVTEQVDDDDDRIPPPDPSS